jgi:hypothetical protein
VGAPVLILIDEFSVFLQKALARDQPEAEALLAWLRGWRLVPGAACRFLFTGSVGLNALLESQGMSAQFNDCFEYQIGPFKPNAARDMIISFATREHWTISAETAQHLCGRVGWLSPFYLCLLLDQSKQAARDRLEESSSSATRTLAQEIVNDDVDDGYERLLSARSRFVHWEQRLERDCTPKELALHRTVLTKLAKAPAGLTLQQLMARSARLHVNPDLRRTRLQACVRRLQEEGYTSAPDPQGRIQFLSPLLRDYWARNHA